MKLKTKMVLSGVFLAVGAFSLLLGVNARSGGFPVGLFGVFMALFGIAGLFNCRMEKAVADRLDALKRERPIKAVLKGYPFVAFDTTNRAMFLVDDKKTREVPFSTVRGWQPEWTATSNGGRTKCRIAFHTTDIDRPIIKVRMDNGREMDEWASRLPLLMAAD